MRIWEASKLIFTGSAVLFGASALADEAVRIDEIIVTATKTGETSLQDTPIAISAFNAGDVDKANIKDIRDIINAVPGSAFATENNAMQIYIRGIGTNNVFIGGDPSVTVHLDGVYLGRPTMQFLDFVELERVEVLRGPQGTLYGRNSAGGTINVIPRAPSDEFNAKLSAETGSFTRMRFTGYVNGPIVGDRLLGNLSFFSDRRDGYVRQLNDATFNSGDEPFGPTDTQAVTAKNLNNVDRTGARAALRYLGDGGLTIDLSADYLWSDERGGVDKPLGVMADGSAPPFPSTEISDDPYEVYTNFDPRVGLETWGVTGRITKTISDNLELSSTTAYRESDSLWHLDQDYTEVNFFNVRNNELQWQFSQELQLTGNYENFDFVAGLYYFKEDHEMLARARTDFVLFDLVEEVNTKTYAAFAQGTYRVTDQLSVTAGLRYNYDKKHIEGGFTGGFFQDQKDNWDAITPKFTLSYQPTDDLMVYGSVSRGFKSGGFNFSAPVEGFGPEYLWAYEAGVKAEWLNNKLRTNLTAFYYDYTDLQVSSQVAIGINAISNAATAKNKGVELEVVARPTAELQLSGSVAYLDATYSNYLFPFSIDGTVDVSGNRLNHSPKWSYDLAAEYTKQLPQGGELAFRAEYKWRDRVYYTPLNQPVMSEDSLGLLQARVAYTTANDRWTFELYGKNLTDENYYTFRANFSPVGVTGKINEPRTWGAKLTYRM